MSIFDERPAPNKVSIFGLLSQLVRRYSLVIICALVLVAYPLYLKDLSVNPPGFFVDEAGIGYNAYLLAHTGRGESGLRFPLFFPFFTSGWTVWANPTQIYLLAIPFRFFRPSILLSRGYAATWVFLACILLGFLAKEISASRLIGALVGIFALVTPWLFEVSRLVFEVFFFPMAVVLLLTSLYYAQRKQSWSWLNVVTVTLGLTLITYTYTIGRLLGPLLAGGLILFATSARRIISVTKTWVLFALTMIPLLVFRSEHPEALTQRFYLLSYIQPNSTWTEIVPTFIKRYLEDFSLIYLLIDGDGNPRHHVTGSLGSFLVGVFALTILGLILIIVRHWRDPWWRFILFGTLASVVPGALTRDQFHSMRMIAYPIFLLVLTIPALQFLLEGRPLTRSEHNNTDSGKPRPLSIQARRSILALALLVTAAQVIYFQKVFRREGPKRGWVFDASYKNIYDLAVLQPKRPIYLIDGSTPAYIHAYWYAVVEGRDTSQFIHLDEGEHAPSGFTVISSEQTCSECQVITKEGEFLLYRSR